MKENIQRIGERQRPTAPVRGAILPLAGGGHIAFDEYGDPNGVPVVFCHGWPSSRCMAQLTDKPARDLGARIISPDRPGIVDSSFHPGRTLNDWPEVVRALTAHLGIERFRILAISGGAPYAFVTALAFPERVVALSVVSGAPPIAELWDRSGLWRVHRWMLALHATRPGLLRTLMRIARPFAAARLSLRLRPFLRFALQRMDAEALRDRPAFEACFESSRRAWMASLDGVMVDAEVYARPWGFHTEEITRPVRMWHGRKDRTFACRLAEEFSERLPNCRLKVVEDAGHYSLPIRHMLEILRDLVSA